MGDTTRWLLPNGIDELLPEQAGRVEGCRRLLLDTCATWGYEYVEPPLVEFTDSLLVGLGADLEVLSCKFADRETGRTLAVRADITPQVARIDAHSLGRAGVSRLCYAGSTLKSVADTIPADRSPVQLGAEIFGCAGIDADIEIVELVLSLVRKSHLSEITFDIGHVGFCQLVLDSAGLSAEQQEEILALLARKANSELDKLLTGLGRDQRLKVSQLASMHGGLDVLSRAKEVFGDLAGVNDVIGDLEAVLSCCERADSGISVYIDLTEAHGYRYHSGVVFALYARELGAAIAKGGRYDGVGEVFGRKRPATGFAVDLKAWSSLARLPQGQATCISSPVDACPVLMRKESELRTEGHVVVKAVGGEIDVRCSHQLVNRESEWLVEPVESN
jgi:ATP phosphoribosyltransferase regulatory subunit